MKVMQVDSVQQLTPFIEQYTRESGDIKLEKKELAQCRMIVLYRYLNLGG